MTDEKEPEPVVEKTVAQPPPLPGSAAAPQTAPPIKPATNPTGPTAEVAAAMQLTIAASKAIAAIPNASRNIQTALRMCNDASGLLMKG